MPAFEYNTWRKWAKVTAVNALPAALKASTLVVPREAGTNILRVGNHPLIEARCYLRNITIAAGESFDVTVVGWQEKGWGSILCAFTATVIATDYDEDPFTNQVTASPGGSATGVCALGSTASGTCPPTSFRSITSGSAASHAAYIPTMGFRYLQAYITAITAGCTAWILARPVPAVPLLA